MSSRLSPEQYRLKIEDLGLQDRTKYVLLRHGISSVGVLAEFSDDDLLKIRNFGARSLDDLKSNLAERGVVRR
jgi:DNA-directed RNA polymerase subunit alpha